MSKIIITLIDCTTISIIILGIVLIAASSSYKDEQLDHQQYCEMVELWQADETRGLPPTERLGWPPYKGECNEK